MSLNIDWFQDRVQEALHKFHMGQWSVRAILDPKLNGVAETTTSGEYFEADIRFNPQELTRRGLNALAVVEHEILHLCFHPLKSFTLQVLKPKIRDMEWWEWVERRLEYEEHQVLERIHRGFNPAAMARTGDLNLDNEM